PPAVRDEAAKPVDLARIIPEIDRDNRRDRDIDHEHATAWHGTILPETDADLWLATAFADYERIVAHEKAIKARVGNGKLGIRDRERLALDVFAPTSRYLAAVARRGGKDIALADTRSDLRADEWYDIASGKGVLVLAELRGLLGDQRFETFMNEFGRAHAGR